MEHALTRALGQQGPQFVVGDGIVGRRIPREKTHYQIRTLAEQPHQRGGHPGEPGHERRRQDGKALGIGQGYSLRHQFAQHQRQVGHRQDHEAGCQLFGIGGKRRGLGEMDSEVVGESCARVQARQDGRQRNARLAGRQQQGGVLLQADGHARAQIATLRHGFQTRTLGGDQGQLRESEEGINDQQQREDEEFFHAGGRVNGRRRRRITLPLASPGRAGRPGART